ncbi:hypothetical protein GY45DRAFT_1328078 [Cubamyces sp. BRFM 1775]|nr:hypothetical protein GY45DRAFT_1328078 [Cubamyces sp. BRFM 1775]
MSTLRSPPTPGSNPVSRRIVSYRIARAFYVSPICIPSSASSAGKSPVCLRALNALSRPPSSITSTSRALTPDSPFELPAHTSSSSSTPGEPLDLSPPLIALAPAAFESARPSALRLRRNARRRWGRCVSAAKDSRGTAR